MHLFKKMKWVFLAIYLFTVMFYMFFNKQEIATEGFLKNEYTLKTDTRTEYQRQNDYIAEGYQLSRYFTAPPYYTDFIELPKKFVLNLEFDIAYKSDLTKDRYYFNTYSPSILLSTTPDGIKSTGEYGFIDILREHCGTLSGKDSEGGLKIDYKAEYLTKIDDNASYHIRCEIQRFGSSLFIKSYITYDGETEKCVEAQYGIKHLPDSVYLGIAGERCGISNLQINRCVSTIIGESAFYKYLLIFIGMLIVSFGTIRIAEIYNNFVGDDVITLPTMLISGVGGILMVVFGSRFFTSGLYDFIEQFLSFNLPTPPNVLFWVPFAVAVLAFCVTMIKMLRNTESVKNAVIFLALWPILAIGIAFGIYMLLIAFAIVLMAVVAFLVLMFFGAAAGGSSSVDSSAESSPDFYRKQGDLGEEFYSVDSANGDTVMIKDSHGKQKRLHKDGFGRMVDDEGNYYDGKNF